MAKFGTIFLSVFMVHLLAHCGDEPATTKSPGAVHGSPIEESVLSDTYVAAICGELETCCGVSQFPFSRADCDANYRKQIEALIADAKAKKLEYRREHAGDCIAAMKADVSSCKTLDYSTYLGKSAVNRYDSCYHIFEGNTPQGKPCEAASDCVFPLYCRFDPVAMIPVCTGTLPSPREEGARCIFTTVIGNVSYDFPCVSGYSCNRKSEMCEATPGLGKPCNVSCKEGLYCNFRKQESTCEQSAKLGEKCSGFYTPPGGTNAPLCDDDLECADGATCVPLIRPLDEFHCAQARL